MFCGTRPFAFCGLRKDGVVHSTAIIDVGRCMEVNMDISFEYDDVETLEKYASSKKELLEHLECSPYCLIAVRRGGKEDIDFIEKQMRDLGLNHCRMGDTLWTNKLSELVLNGYIC